MDSAYGYENGLARRQPNEIDLESVIVICWRPHAWSGEPPGARVSLALRHTFRPACHGRADGLRAGALDENQTPFDRLIVLMFT